MDTGQLLFHWATVGTPGWSFSFPPRRVWSSGWPLLILQSDSSHFEVSMWRSQAHVHAALRMDPCVHVSPLISHYRVSSSLFPMWQSPHLLQILYRSQQWSQIFLWWLGWWQWMKGGPGNKVWWKRWEVSIRVILKKNCPEKYFSIVVRTTFISVNPWA